MQHRALPHTALLMFMAWLVYSASAWAQASDAANIARRIQDLYEVGKFDEALPLAEREVELREASKNNETLALADSLTMLALLYRWSGQLDSAKRVHLRALAIREKHLPADHPDIAVSLNHLAGIYKILRALKLSQKFYDRALEIREKSLPPDHPAIAETLTGLALLGWVQGRHDTEPMLRRALEIREKALPSSHPDIASSLTNLAAEFHGRHRLAEAEVLYERALKMREATLSPSHPDIVMSLYALSRVGLQLGDWAKALRYARRATTILSQAGQRANLFTDRATAAEYGTKLHSFIFGLHVLAAHREGSNDPAMRGEAYEIAQLAEKSAAGAALAQMAARQATGSTELSTLVRERQMLSEQWRSEEWRLGGALGRGDASTADAARRTIMEVETHLKALDARLAGDFKRYAAAANPKPLSLATSQALLRDDEVLLVFADAGPFPGFAPEAYAWALTKTDVRWTKLSINYLGILRLVQALRCGLDRDGNWVWSSSTNRWQAREKGCAAIRPDGLAREELLPFDLARAHALYQALIGPFEDMIEGKKVLIVPPAQMATLPPSVLVTEVPDPAFTGPEAFRKAAWWGRRQPITVLPSVSSLQVLRGFAKPPQAIHPMIGFGNPLLDGDPSNPEHAQRAAVAQQKQSCRSRPLRDAESQRLVTPRSFTGPVPRKGTIDLEAIRAAPPLPETADELCAVANVLGATEDDIFLGSRATKTAVLTKSAEGVLARYRIVHFATHGLLAGETQLFATGHAEPALLMTPPRAQAGTDDPQHDDGLLTASDVGQLQLNAEWVILSACNTAAGGEMGGEAFSGLARAFFYAGARALLVSHWYVDSDATVRLVTRATSELQSEPTMTRSEALRRAMMALIDDTSNERTVHPATWAPFVVVGEGAR